MKKVTIKFLYLKTSLLFLTIFPLIAIAQPTMIEVGDKNVNSAILSTGSFVWEQKHGFSFEDKEKPNERFITIKRTDKEITIEERLTKKGIDAEKTTTVLNAQTLEPIRSTFSGEDYTYSVSYGTKLKGQITYYSNNEKVNIDEPMKEKCFDISTLDYVVSTLPLAPGYKAFIPVIYPEKNKNYRYVRYKITDIVETKAFSCLSGHYDILEVKLEGVYGLSTKHKTVYVDKKTRRIVRILDGLTPTYGTIYEDLEQHINPIKTKFDAKEAKAMISQGTSTMTGQAYSLDDNMPRSMLQRVKKIIAPKGSLVMLIPNTPYLKEWLGFNASVRKANPPEYLAGKLYRGCHGYPLPIEVKEQSLVAEIMDNKGSFAFQNLKPGEYHVYVQFVATKYTNTTRTPNGSYNVTINPDGSGSAVQNVDITHWGSPTEVSSYKLVKIAKDGETVKVKLRD